MVALWIIFGIVCVGFLWNLIDKAIDLYQNRTINERIKKYQADKESELRHLNQNILHATEELERQTNLLQLLEHNIQEAKTKHIPLLSEYSNLYRKKEALKEELDKLIIANNEEKRKLVIANNEEKRKLDEEKRKLVIANNAEITYIKTSYQKEKNVLINALKEENVELILAHEKVYSYFLDILAHIYTKKIRYALWPLPLSEKAEEVKASITDQLLQAKKELDELRRDIERGIPSTIKNIACLYAEVEGRMYDIHGNLLICKKHPAYGTATEVKIILKKEIKEVTRKWKEAQLNYEVLKATIEKEVSDDIDYEEIEIETTEDDKTERDWLSKEEYEQLDDTQRSALALEKYIKRNKTKRQIGRDYEEYIAHLFRTYRGFSRSYIYMQGQIKGLEDLGRDIIVKNKNKIYIVQCKRWSRERKIRENAIMQLFGTVCEYCLEHRLNPMNVIGDSVFAIFCTTTELSETAMRFAKVLQIQVYNVPQEEFPRIKCNVGQNGEKIYHLPFDQQYNSIIIESNKGEKLVWTPQEAEQEGFRRAKRHMNI